MKLDTAEDLLTLLIVVNEHGVWFVKMQDRDGYHPLPKWLWAACERLVKEPTRI